MVNDYYSAIKKMQEYAEENNVPIMTNDGITFLTDYIKKNNSKRILEIGTAIAYSTIMMALTNPEAEITTIERDEKRYLEAIKNVKKFKLEDRIHLIYNDALNVNLEEEFDLIFIDAAKAQNIKFFEIFSQNLSSNGTIITDNMNFHGLVDKDASEIKSRNLRALVRKVRDYRNYLKENPKFTTAFYNIGDGIAVSKRKKENA